MTTNVLMKPWVVAPPAHDAIGFVVEPVVWLRGKDYPRLCEKCRSAIDQAAQILPEIEPWGPMYDPEDIEVPMMFAYDRAWLCGGHECDCVREPEVEIVAAMTVQTTTYGPGIVVDEEHWDILPIFGNGYDLSQLAVQVADEIGDKVRVWGYRVLTVVDHPGPERLRTEIEFEVFFEEKPALEALWRAGGYEVWHEV